MHWIDWIIALCPLIVVAALIVWGRGHVRSVADFLTGGRVAGRYLLAVSGMGAAQGIFGLLAMYEAYYQSGFAYGFWNALNTVTAIVMSLTGYCTYRYRETRAMTMGQFLEMRYSRRFRIFGGCLQSLSGVLNYGLFPAVSSQFFVFFCGLPTEFELFGFAVRTWILIMAIYLTIAVLLATSGGQLSIMVADCIVGVLSYPMYLCVVVYIVLKFSWFHDFAPALLDRPRGFSMINPFDIAQLRDFNIFYVIVGIFGGIINQLAWSGNQGFSAAGRNAHEQKMAGILQTWRTGFSMMMYILVPVLAISFFNSIKFQAGPRGSDACRIELASKVASEVLPGKPLAAPRSEVVAFLREGKITPALQSLLDKSAAFNGSPDAGTAAAAKASSSDAPMAPSARVQVARDAIRAVDPAASQRFATIFREMSVPMTVRYIMPVGIIGIFCAICIGLLMSTDASYQHSWGSIIVQDIILPLRKTPLSPRRHLLVLRCLIVFVATFAFFFSCFFGQIDYILMFQQITGAIWLGGSGPCIVGGLYWKRGTTVAAWCTLIAGSGLALLSIAVQRYWVGLIYPWFVKHEMVDTVARWLQTASRPFEPIIKWRMSADKFPINSQELFAINMLVSVGTYVAVSLLTSREPFNMDRLLHRGKYRRADEPILTRERFTLRNAFSKLIGIDPQYTRGDKILAWSVFIWSFGWGFGVCFGIVTIWNLISPWSNYTWSKWFYINNIVLAGVIGAVSTVWFTIGGSMDLRRLFRDLKTKRENILDDGHVIGRVSADEVAQVEKVEHVTTGEEGSHGGTEAVMKRNIP